MNNLTAKAIQSDNFACIAFNMVYFVHLKTLTPKAKAIVEWRVISPIMNVMVSI